MKTKLIIPVIGLVMAMFGATALAANFTMGNSYGTPMNITYSKGNAPMQSIYGAGGNFGATGHATLDNVSLAYVYCIDLFDNINLNTSYSATVTSNGTVAETPAHAIGNTDANGLINNAAAIAWLIDSLASSAVTGDQQSGLQVAIWTEIYGAMGGSGPNSWNIVGISSSIQAAMTADLAALASASDFINSHSTGLISSVYWIDPTNGTTQYQQQVGANPINLASIAPNPVQISSQSSSA